MFAVNASLTRIAQDFDVSQDKVKWAVVSYLIGVGVLMYPAGFVSDSFGHHRVCLFGTSLFFIATLLCSLAGSVNQLILFRLLQGCAAGITVPSGVALLTTYYPDFRRKIALLTTIGSFSMALGPVVGGFFPPIFRGDLFLFCVFP